MRNAVENEAFGKFKISDTLWRVKRERSPIAVNWLGCTTHELL